VVTAKLYAIRVSLEIQEFCPAKTTVLVDRKVARTPLRHIHSTVCNNREKQLLEMKLFEKKHWIIYLLSLCLGLIFTAFVQKLYFGEIYFWVLLLTGFIGIAIGFLVSRHANN